MFIVLDFNIIIKKLLEEIYKLYEYLFIVNIIIFISHLLYLYLNNMHILDILILLRKYFKKY